MCEEKESKAARKENDLTGLMNRMFTNGKSCIQDTLFYKFVKLLV